MSKRRFIESDQSSATSDSETEDASDSDDSLESEVEENVQDRDSVDMFENYDNEVLGAESDDDDYIDELMRRVEEERECRHNNDPQDSSNHSSPTGSQSVPDSPPFGFTQPSPVPPTQPTWNWVPGGNVEPPVPFDDTDSDWTYDFDASSSELDLFQITFPAAVINFVTNEINNFAEMTITNCQTPSRRQAKWQPIQNKELIRYLAIRILMGIDKKPQYSDYWSKDPLLRSTIVPQIMTSDRFFEIHRYLHFCDNSMQQPGDQLHKIRQVWEMCMTNFSEILQPSRDLSIDETLVKFKGRLSFKQFIPSKRNRVGFKLFSVVDAKTGFVLKSKIYAGKGKDHLKFPVKEFGYGGAMLLELAEPYFKKNHVIYADNYFNSPAVAKKLLNEKTYLCGTVNSNRKNLPKFKKLKTGEFDTFHSVGQNSGVMVEAWRDRRLVKMISTGFNHATTDVNSRTGVVKKKPSTVVSYNKLARGIDLSDMQIHIYETNRKSYKWYKKLFMRLVDLALYNALVMQRIHHPKKSFLQFRLNVVRQMLQLTGGTSAPNPSPLVDTPLRLTERHFVARSPSTPSEKVSNRRCFVCTKNKKSKRTVYFCPKCQVPLCVVPCFEIYHTKKKI